MDLRKKAAAVIDVMRDSSIDEGLVRVQESEMKEIYYEAGKISMVRTVFQENGFIKIIKDRKIGEIQVSRIEDENLKTAVKDALTLSQEGSEDEFAVIPEHSEVKELESGVLDCDEGKMFDRLNEFVESVRKEFPAISLESGGIEHTLDHSFISTTKGANLDYRTGKYNFNMMFMAKDENKVSSFNFIGQSMMDLDTPLLDMDGFRKTLSETEKQIHPVSKEGDLGCDVILSPFVTAQMTYFMISKFLGDKSIYTETSVWKDSIGKKVASENVTLSLDPLDFPAGSLITGDFYLAENMPIIEKGVLKNFVLSDYGAKRAGKKRSRNQSFNLHMNPGDKSLEDMIKGVKKGILINRFSGGDPTSGGDFAGIAKNSFLIENGEIKESVTEVMVAGNLREMFENIVEISSEAINNGSYETPYIRTSALKVSGK